jgi:hypothetical protein
MNQQSSILKINHNSGFFSCCTIRLQNILDYYKKYNRIPDLVDSSAQFSYYKSANDKDITYLLFQNDQLINVKFNKDIYIFSSSNKENQFSEYYKINFQDTNPFILKYFTPSINIQNIVNNLINKYNIDFDNTCAVMYRGNDKILETNQPSYQDIYEKTIEIRNKHNNIRFLLQTDELEFLNYGLQKFPNSFHIEETPKINKQVSSIQLLNKFDKNHLMNYISSIIIMSKCKYIITTSGNGEMWMILWRGNTNNVHQYLNPKEYIYGVYNPSFDKNMKNFWI